MTFDPTQPFEVEPPSKSGSGFDPSQPFEVEKPPSGGYAGEQEPGYTSGAMLPFRYKADAQGNSIPGSVEYDPMRSGLSGSIFRGLHDVDVHATGQAGDVYNPRINPDTLGLLGLGASPEIWTRPVLPRPIPLNPGDLSQRQITGPPEPPPAPAGGLIEAPPTPSPSEPAGMPPAAVAPQAPPASSAAPASPVVSPPAGAPAAGAAPGDVPTTTPPPMTPGASWQPQPQTTGRDPTVAPAIQGLAGILADPRSAEEIAAHAAQEEHGRVAEFQTHLPAGWEVLPRPGGGYVLKDPLGAAVPTPDDFPGYSAFGPLLATVAQQEQANAPAYEAIRRQGTGTAASPVVAQNPSDIPAAAGNAAQPTPGQAAAGNYQHGHVKVGGLDIAIETPAGGIRSGVGADGKPWSVTMPVDYGRIKGTKGADGEQLDVYLGPHVHQADKHPVFIVDQRNHTAPWAFDEHKAMIGFPDEATALQAYRSAFSDGQGHARIGAVFPTTWPAFRAWIANGNLRQPIRYKAPHEQLDAFARKADLPPLTPQERDHAAGLIFTGSLPHQAVQDVLNRAIEDYLNRAHEMLQEEERKLAQRIDAFIGKVLAAAKAAGVPLTPTTVEMLHAFNWKQGAIAQGGSQQPAGTVPGNAGGGQPAGSVPGANGQGQPGSNAGAPGQAGNAGTGRPPETRPAEGAGAETGQPGGVKGRRQIGVNPSGRAVSEDERGVRSYLEDGIRITEPVGLRPDGSIVLRPNDRSDDFKTVEEIAASKPQSSAAEPKLTTLAEGFADEFRSGRTFSSIVQARQFAARYLGNAVQPGTPQAKLVDEAVELGVVMAARTIAQGWGTKDEKYAALVKLYGQQPTLGTRTSDSVERQAYSTPVPLAFIASHLAGITSKSSVYEPTAGNGALLIGADPAHTTANEIDRGRRDALEAQGFKTTGWDATHARPNKQFDTVIANPPFGAVRGEDGQSKTFDLAHIQPNYTTHEVDHAIAFRALEAMKDDGKAVLILGGLNKQVRSPQGRADGYNGKSKREFYFSLYGKYNVVDHFTVSGELYAKQGAAWPVDVIVIDGRGKSSLPLPAVTAPPVLATWDDLKGLLDGNGRATRPAETGVVSPGSQPGGSGGRDQPAAPEARPDAGTVRPGTGEPGAADAGGGGGGVASVGQGAGGKPRGPRGVERPGGVRQPPRGGTTAAGGQPAGAPVAPAEPGNQPAAGGEVAGAPTAPGPGGDRGDDVSGVAGPGAPKPAQSGVEPKPDFGKALLDALDEEMPPAPPVKTADDALRQAGEGLGKLFGPARPRFSLERAQETDEGIWQQARPLFRQAYAALRESLDDTAALARALIRHARDVWKMTREQIQQMVPYLERFQREIEAGTEKIDEEAKATAPPPDLADQAPPVKPAEAPTASQVPYEPASRVPSVDTLVPSNMRTAIRDALTDLEKRIQETYPTGVDAFVADKLGYTPAELSGYFSAEQVDALALGIEQIDRGSGFIIGDQTGVGKGRFVAGLIRYAEMKGMVPIFVTEKPNLYADMYRDLTDIGMPGMENAILPTNSGMKLKLTDEDDGPRLRTPAAKAHILTVQQIASSGELPPGKRVVFTTYNQLQQIKGMNTPRMNMVSRLSHRAFVILDEAHNAGGAGVPEDQATAGGKVPRSVFLRRVVQAARATAFSSATWAKRPDVLDLYGAKTDMRHAVGDLKQLAQTISRGGVPMQQIVTAHLARRGQYTRREKSFAGVTYDTHSVDVDRRAYDDVSSVLANIFKISSKYAKKAVKDISNDIRDEAQSVGADASIGDAGASSTSFGAVMHNLINQLLLASKAPGVVELALERLKANEKPVIALANTMGSFIAEFAGDSGAKPGDPMKMDFNSLLRRYLNRTLRYSVRKPFMKKGEEADVHWLAPEDLGPEGEALYRATEEMIDGLDLSQFPASPIDYIRAKLRAAGYEVGEITGRTEAADYTADGRVLYRTRSGSETSPNARQEAIRAFNRGDTHVMILNQSGATGLSLHASSKFKDQRKRVMLIAQAEPNIDTHMQMLGRVHRTGQVVTPAYLQMVANVPAENRPAAVLAMKMASLSASTTANRRSQMSSDKVVDFMNRYGGQVIEQILADDPELEDKLGNPTKKTAIKAEDEDEGPGGPEDDDPVAVARKVTGRIPLLPLAEQEIFYAEIESRYVELLRNLDEAGENSLEAKTLDLDARSLESKTLRDANGSDAEDPFRAAALLERMDVRRLTRPPTPGRIVADLGKFYEDSTAGAEDDWLGQPVEKVARQIEGMAQSNGSLNVEAYSERVSNSVDDVIARAKDTIDDEKKLDQHIARTEANRARLIDVLTYAVPGTIVEFQSLDGTNTHYAMVTGVKLRGDNAVVPSAWDLHLLGDDGARMNMALTNVYTASNQPLGAPPENARRISPSDYPLDGFLRLMVNGAQQAREERWIATGNILGAFGELRGEGQIVNFTDQAGDLKQGILLPRRFDIEKWEGRRAPVLSPEKAIAFLRTDQGDTPPFVQSSDRAARISKDTKGGFVISAPKSKTAGGEYWLDSGLRQAIGGDFVSAGNIFRATFDAERMPAVVRALSDLGAKSGANIVSTHPAAKAFAAPPKPPPAPKGDILNRIDRLRVGPTSETAADPKAVKAALSAARTMTGGKVSAEIGLMPTQAQGVTIGRVIRAALSTEVPRVLRHETIHALRNMGVINPREWATLEAAAKRGDWVRAHGIDTRYRNLTETEMLEEAIGEQFAKWEVAEAPKGPLARSFNVVNTFFHRAKNKLAQRGFQTADDVFGRIEAGEVGERPIGSEDETRGPTTIAESQADIDRWFGHSVHNFPVLDEEGREFNLADVDDRDGMPRYSLQDPGGGWLVGTTPRATPVIDRIRRIPRIGDGLATKLASFADSGRTALEMVAPMTGGTVDTRADAKLAANDWRDQRWSGNHVLKQLMTQFSLTERKTMYQATDAERVAARFGQPMVPTHGLATLNPTQRAMTEALIRNAEVSWARARRVGIHDKDGQDYYVPAMVMKYGEPDAHVVEDIATLALATMRLNEAIAGRMLINRIKATGARLGHPTVGYGLSAGGPGFSFEPTIGIKTSTPNVQGRKYDTVEETEAAAALGQPMAPGWFTRPENAAFYQLRYRGIDNKTGEPIFDRVPIWIHPDYKAPLNAILRREYSARFIYKGLMGLKGRMMQTIMFGVSHLAVIAVRALPAANGNPVKLYRMAKEGYASKNDPAVMRRFIQAGMVPIGRHFGHLDVEGIEKAEQIEPGRSWTANILAFVPGLISDRAGIRVKKAVDAAGKFAHETLLWDRVQDIQVGVALGLERRLMAAGLDPRSATAIAAHFSNRYAGSLPKESMSQLAEEIANTILFSRSYRLGGLGMIKDAIKGLPKDVQATILRQSGAPALKRANSAARRLAIATLAIDLALLMGMYTVGQGAFNVALDAYNGSTIGQAISREAKGQLARWVHEVQNFPSQANPINILRDLTPMGTMNETGGHEPGKEARILVGFQADGTGIYMRVPAGKFGEDVVDYLTHPYDTAHNVLSPFARVGLGFFTNDAGFGRHIFNPDFKGFGETVEAAGDLAAWSLGQMGPSMALGSAKNLVTGKGGWMDAAKIAGAATGFSFSLGHPGGPLEGLMAKIGAAERFKIDRAMPAIREAIKAGEQEKATKLMDEAGIKDRYYRRYIRMHTKHPNMTPKQLQRLTGSASEEQLRQLQGAREFQRERPRPAP